MTDNAELKADKYAKLVVENDVTNTASTALPSANVGDAFNGKDITATLKSGGTKIGSDTFVKATDTVVITIATTADAGTKTAGAVDATGAFDVAGITVAELEDVMANDAAFDSADANKKDITFTVSGAPSAGTGTATLTVTLKDAD